MVEFKVCSGLSGEISAFESAGSKLTDKSTSVDSEKVSSLKTSVKFIEEHESIINLLKLYQRLVSNEVIDLNEMKESAESLDAAIAGKIK